MFCLMDSWADLLTRWCRPQSSAVLSGGFTAVPLGLAGHVHGQGGGLPGSGCDPGSAPARRLPPGLPTPRECGASGLAGAASQSKERVGSDGRARETVKVSGQWPAGECLGVREWGSSVRSRAWRGRGLAGCVTHKPIYWSLSLVPGTELPKLLEFFKNIYFY